MKNQAFKWSNVLVIVLVLFLLSAAAFFLPLKRHEQKLVAEVKAAERRVTLQDLIQSGGLRTEEITQSQKEFLFPFESISLEKTPCFGPCPVYVVTFNRDGSAELTKNNWETNQVKTYAGKLWLLYYARLTQLTLAARKAAHQDRYAGQWTDSSTSIIRVKSKEVDWTVSDYGAVSPVEVWVLAEMLHTYQEQTEWKLVSKVPIKGPTTQSR